MSNDYDPNDPVQVAEHDEKLRQLLEKQQQERREKAQAFTDRQKAPIIDATAEGVGVWGCGHCGQHYLLENGFRRFDCVNGCPNSLTKRTGVSITRPADAVVKRIRRER